MPAVKRLFSLILVIIFIISVTASPFYVSRTFYPTQWHGDSLSKRALDKCGCNLGCFFSSARECMSCCALALR